MNAPPTFESFLLYDGGKNIIKEADTKDTNAAIFTFNKEDHTIGNVIRNYDKLQTMSDYTSQDTMTNAITDFLAELPLFEERFKETPRERKRTRL